MSTRNADRIVAVRASLMTGTGAPEPMPDDLPEEIWHWRTQKVANPMTNYEEFRASRSQAIGGNTGGLVVVEVESASGHVGVATTNGGVPAAAIIELSLAPYVEGESPWAHERLWDRMFRSSLSYGRKGVTLHAISGVDLAVWDLHGKITETPVHTLLGGPVHESIASYATGPSAANIAQLGFWGAKLPLTYGPAEGEEGFRANVDRAAAAREAVGPDLPLMYDCWMALDLEYAVRLSHALQPLGFRWIEDALLPDDYKGFAELRRRMPPTMMLATGEHEYTAAGHAMLAEAGVDIVQPDPQWCGGITEMRRIAAAVGAYGKRVVPHAGGEFSYHFLASYADAFLAEFPVMGGLCDDIRTFHTPLLTGEVLPKDGRIHFNDKPGFGMEINTEVGLVRPMTREVLAGLR